MSRQALRFTKETTPGAMPGSPAVGTQTILRMTSPVTDEPEPLFWEIRDAGGSNRRVQFGSAQNKLMLKISTPVYFSQAKLLIAAFCTPVAGLPGLTTFGVDRLVKTDDASLTARYARYLGLTPQNLTVHCTNTGQGVVMMADMDFAYRSVDRTITVADFADPALTAYPSDQPFVLEQMAGQVTIGSAITAFKSFSLSVKNTLDIIYDENANPTPQYYGSRDVDWQLDLRYKAQTLRAAYEAITAQAVSFGVSDGTNSITWNLQSVNRLKSLGNDLPLDKAFYQKLSGEAFLDSAAGTDMTCTIAP